jgi:hypothetical protein
VAAPGVRFGVIVTVVEAARQEGPAAAIVSNSLTVFTTAMKPPLPA